MSGSDQASFAGILNACMVLKAAGEKAGMRSADLFVMIEPEHFNRLMEIVKAGANAKTSSGNGLLVNGFPIFRSDTSDEERRSFMRDATERLSRVHAETPGHA